MTNIEDYISTDYKAINIEENIAVVRDFFHELTFSHFPVTEEGIYIGCIALDDIETFEDDKKVIDYRYALEGIYARPDMIWLDVLEVFAKNHTNLVPVLGENNKYIGYYELEDIIKFFHETPFLQEPGGIIVIKKSVLEYSMSQITQIIESNNGKILGMFISEADVEYIQVTIKISLGAMNEILQTFRRYNYEIISEHNEDEYLNVLKDRSDYLDKYLNM
jgi:predicted transcriptional regulator